MTGGKTFGLALSCLMIAVLAIGFSLIGPGPIQPAFAQERSVRDGGNIRSFNPFAPLLRLFGVGQTERRRIEKPVVKQQPSRPAGTPPAFVEEPKNPDAGVILVVGDRMARGVGEGLKYLLADKPMVRVDLLTEDRKGFAGDDAPDWSGQALARIRGADVKAVVVMIGQHDRNKEFPGEPPLEYMTDAWIAEYRKKAADLVHTVHQERKPLIWVGLPPTNTAAKNADFTILNDIFSGVVGDSRTWFVDIWDIFLNEEGAYSSYGPNVAGKNALLRSSDRTGFTWAGYQKVAFFVERELSSILGGYGGYAFEGVDDDPNFIVLTGRITPPDEELLGSDQRAGKLDKESMAYRFFVKGESLAPVPGRADYTKLAVPDGS